MCFSPSMEGRKGHSSVGHWLLFSKMNSWYFSGSESELNSSTFEKWRSYLSK